METDQEILAKVDRFFREVTDFWCTPEVQETSPVGYMHYEDCYEHLAEHWDRYHQAKEGWGSHPKREMGLRIAAMNLTILLYENKTGTTV